MENFEVVYFPWAEAEILKGDYPLGGAGGGGGGGGGERISYREPSTYFSKNSSNIFSVILVFVQLSRNLAC